MLQTISAVLYIDSFLKQDPSTMITFLCYLALGIFIFIPVWSSFFGTPIIKKKEPGFYQEKNTCLILVLPFSPIGAVLNCAVFI